MEYTRPELRAAFGTDDQTIRETDLAALDYEHQLVPLEPLEAATDVAAEQVSQLEWRDLRDFPRARVVYSERPRFFAGSRVVSRAAKDLRLARPVVAEALEAVHQTRRQSSIDHEDEKDRIDPLNPKLALAGCNWLLQEKLRDEDRASYLRIATAQTKAQLSEQVKRISKAHRQPSVVGSGVVEPVSVEQPAPDESSDDIVLYKIIARQTRDELVDRLQREVPEAEPDACIRLLDCLEIAMDDEGRLSASAGKAFETEAERQIQLCLRDPQQLMNFLTAQIYLADYCDLAATPDSRHPYDLYLRASTEFTQRLLAHSYSMSEFSPATFNKWFAIIDELSVTANTYHRARAESSTAKLPVHQRAEVSFLVTFERICRNSLRHVADSQPKKVTSKVYELASAGLQPEHQLRMAFTHESIKEFYMQNPLAAAVLNRQLMRITLDTTAVDLFETLFTIDSRRGLSVDEFNIDGIISDDNGNLSTKQRNRLDRLYPTPSYLRAIARLEDDATAEVLIKQHSKEINAHLRAKMATYEGHTQTLLGRFQSFSTGVKETAPSGNTRSRVLKRLLGRR